MSEYTNPEWTRITIHDLEPMESGYINANNGNFVASDNSKASGFMPLHDPGMVLTFMIGHGSFSGLAFYDKNKTFISMAVKGDASRGASVETIVPALTYYIRYSANTDVTASMFIDRKGSHVRRFVQAVARASFGKNARKPIADACERIHDDGPKDLNVIRDSAFIEIDKIQEQGTNELRDYYDDTVDRALDVVWDTLDDVKGVHRDVVWKGGAQADWASEEAKDYAHEQLKDLTPMVLEGETGDIKEYQAAAIEEVETFNKARVQDATNINGSKTQQAAEIHSDNQTRVTDIYNTAFQRTVPQNNEITRLEQVLDRRVETIQTIPFETWYTYDYALNMILIEGDDYTLDSIRPEITCVQIDGDEYYLTDTKAEDGVQVISGDDYRLALVNPPIAEYYHESDENRLVFTRHNRS